MAEYFDIRGIKILKKVGSGQFGEVMLAASAEGECLYALKIIKKKDGNEGKQIQTLFEVLSQSRYS